MCLTHTHNSPEADAQDRNRVQIYEKKMTFHSKIEEFSLFFCFFQFF